jgi:succinoglycan biosynthesis protein ExoA
MLISIIIPCRNERAHIRALLDSVLAQEIESDWAMEVLVVDGRSDDGTREIVEEYAGKTSTVHMIDNPQRIVSTALNAGILASKGEIVIRMDAHALYAQDYVRECIRALWESGADNVGGPTIPRSDRPLGQAIAAAFHSRFSTGGGKAHDPSYEGEVDTVFNGCWRREMFERVGLFDPALVRNQDDEFNFRLRRCGGRIWQSPRIRSVYAPRGTLGSLFRQYLQYGYWKVAVIRKHGAVPSMRQLVPALFVASAVVLGMAAAGAALLGWRGPGAVAGDLLGAELGLYAAACLAASAASMRYVSLRAAVLLPPVFAAYHAGYGIGFLLGLFFKRAAGAPESQPAGLFTELTR